MINMSASNQQRLFDSNQGSEVKKQRRRRRKPMNTRGGESQGKRKLTEHQGTQLELYFETESKLETERKVKIATELGLEPRQVAVWFQNRRARWKCNKLENEYANLRTTHHYVLAQKANLEAQVSELSMRLLEAKCEIQRLSGRLYESGTSSISNGGNTPSSSMDHRVNREFEAEDMEVFEKEYVQVMECYWMNNNMYDLM